MWGLIDPALAEQILAALAALALTLLAGLILGWPRDDDDPPRGA